MSPVTSRLHPPARAAMHHTADFDLAAPPTSPTSPVGPIHATQLDPADDPPVAHGEPGRGATDTGSVGDITALADAIVAGRDDAVRRGDGIEALAPKDFRPYISGAP